MKEYVDELDTKTNIKQVWKTIRNLDGRVGQRKENEMLVIDGKGYGRIKTRRSNFSRPTRKCQEFQKALETGL